MCLKVVDTRRSGTWSLVGTELDAPVVTTEALRLNFTNEGGVAGTTRLLKNVMGLWMLQCCSQSWAAQGQQFEYRELIELAAREKAFAHFVDPDDESFLRPADMPATIDIEHSAARLSGYRGSAQVSSSPC